MIISVISTTIATPPGSPSLGDTYLVPAAPTGAWVGKTGQIALYTAGGWRFIPPVVGWWLYDKSTDGFFRYTVGGTWIAGPGSNSLSANSVPMSAAINFGRQLIVENQTTNTPPGSPAVGVAYIIGPAPTGVWAGKATQLAVCETTGNWTYYVPTNGFSAYDKSLSAEYRFNGTSWVARAGVWVGYSSVITSTGSLSAAAGVNPYAYSATVAPAGQHRVDDNATLSFAARRAGAVLRFSYRVAHLLVTNPASGGAANAFIVLALYRDAEVNAIDWVPIGTNLGIFPPLVHVQFLTTAPDTSSHTYKVAFLSGFDGANKYDVTTAERRLFTIEEGA